MTQKEFRNLFDSIRCSEELTKRMEKLLSEPPAEEFAEIVSGVSVTHKRSRWTELAGLAACMLLVTGGAMFILQQNRMPSEHSISSGQETETQSTSTSAAAETQTASTQTEYTIVTQTLVQMTTGTSATESETLTETTTKPQTDTEEIAMSDPTIPQATPPSSEQDSDPVTEPPAETTTTTAETTATEIITALELNYDLAMFPMQDLEQRSEEELLTIGYYYFNAADGFGEYVVTCPYDIDYMNIQGRGFEEDGRLWLPVTDKNVTCAADVLEDFYDVYAADQDSSHIPEYYRDMEDGLYFAGKEFTAADCFDGYYLTLDSVTETEIIYTCHIYIEGAVPEYVFRLIRETDGWKVKKFIDPDMIGVCALP